MSLDAVTALLHRRCAVRVCSLAVHRSLAVGLNQNQRDHLLESAIDDLQYVVRRAPPDMALLPEIYYLMGDYFRMLRRIGEASESFKKSRELKADYWPAYAGMADLMLLAGRRADAKATLEQGLAIMPNEVALKSRLERLNGAVQQPPAGAKKASPARAVAPAGAALASAPAFSAKPAQK